MDMKNKSDALHKHLKQHHTGRKNAVSSHELGTAFLLSGREIRKCVNTLRSEGIPICSDENGYYYAASEKEIAYTVTQLNNRIVKIAMARDGIASHK